MSTTGSAAQHMAMAAKQLLRLRILTTCSVIAIIGSLTAGGIQVNTILVVIILVFWYLHAATGNDYADRLIDEINLKGARDRPLLDGNISLTQFWVLHIIGGAISLALSAIYGASAFGLMLTVLLFDYAYSFRPFRLSDRGIISQLTLPLAYVVLPFTLGHLSGPSPGPFPLMLLSGLYAGFIGRLFLKDFRDVKGDKRHGKMTFLLRHDREVTCWMSMLFSFISFVLLLAATNYSVGLGMVLVGSQLLGISSLNTLSGIGALREQLRLIRHIARLANIAVFTLFVHLLCQNQPALDDRWTQSIPLVTGMTLLALNQLRYARSGKVVNQLHFARYKQLSMPSFFQHFAWTWMRPFMTIFCRVKIRGRENLKQIPGNAIIACNHSNEFDPLFIVASLPFTSRLLPISYVSRSKDFYAQLPRGFMYGGKFFELMGAYPVYPGLGDYERSLQHHLDAIRHGRSVGIFPVGRRHKMDEMAQARGGVAYLAHKTGLPILPMRIDGVGEKYTLLDYLTLKCKMTVTFGKPIYTNDIFPGEASPDHATCEKAAVRVMERIANL